MSAESVATTPGLRRALGATGLHVSPLCVGGAEFGSVPVLGYEVPEERALATLRAVFESPINFLDTGASYGQGESERRIGLALHQLGGPPPGFVLATKADRDPRTCDFSAEQVRRSVQRSLRLLGRERLQLVYLHDPEYATQPFEKIVGPGGAVDALLGLKSEGTIEHVGIASGPTDLIIRYVETGMFEVALTHNRYTLLDRSAEPLLDVASRHRVALVNAAPYGGGLLVKGPREVPRYMYRPASEELLGRAERIARICDRYGVPLAAAALQFSLREPRITSTVVGFSHPERVAQTIALATTPVPEALWEELEAMQPPDGMARGAQRTKDSDA